MTMRDKMPNDIVEKSTKSELFLKTPRLCQQIEGEEINTKLREHEETTSDWQFRPLAQELYNWSQIFDVHFKMKLPQVIIVFNEIRRTTYATYQRGRSGFGTKYTITINIRHLKDKYYRTLRRLLHECIHCWQELYGHVKSRSKSKSDKYRWYHNKQFIDKALTCGLLTNHRGHDLGHNEIFSSLLKNHGIDAPETEGKAMGEIESDVQTEHGTSTLKRWSCKCKNVWCAGELHAKCLKCGYDFIKEAK